MKKWLVLLFILLSLSVAGIYVLISDTLLVSEVIVLHGTPSAFARGLSEEVKWGKWWHAPGTGSADSGVHTNSFSYHDCRYEIAGKIYRGLDIVLIKNETRIPSRITILPLTGDSVAIKWQWQMPSGMNPLGRLYHYRQAVSLKKDMAAVLKQLQAFLDKTENIYDFPIERTRVTDTVLVAGRTRTSQYPSIKEIYALIQELRTYVGKQGAFETNPPMMHVEEMDSTHFETMIAIPVSKRLPENNRFFFRGMVPGYILVSEVRGGNHSIRQAFLAQENYISDYQKTKIAIPFESLITDRLQEQDSSRWITKVYCPVVQ